MAKKKPARVQVRRRKLINGTTVQDLPEAAPRKTFEITTACPAKWRMVDLETGEVWRVVSDKEKADLDMLGNYLLDVRLKSWPPPDAVKKVGRTR